LGEHVQWPARRSAAISASPEETIFNLTASRVSRVTAHAAMMSRVSLSLRGLSSARALSTSTPALTKVRLLTVITLRKVQVHPTAKLTARLTFCCPPPVHNSIAVPHHPSLM